MIEIGEAWALIAERARALEAESCPTPDAAGRVLAASVVSPCDLPGFDRSSMDGWALRAAELAGAGPDGLALAGDVAAGSPGGETLPAGAALRISTGAPIPAGADAVLRREDGTEDGARLLPGLGAAVEPGRFVRRRGEDVRAGDELLAAGTRVSASRMSVLASAGVAQVAVHRRPRVAIAATGSELVALGQRAGPGQIHESNGPVLRAHARQAGARAVDLGLVADDPDATEAALAAGLQRADVLLVTGGVSVGVHDHVRPALARLGVQELFWRVRLKPGKPLYCGRLGERWVFGLPGNPLSTVATYLLFVEPLLRRLAGEAGAVAPLRDARLGAPSRIDGDRTVLATAHLRAGEDGELVATPTAEQGSHLTKALAEADAFVVLPHAQPDLPAGAPVRVLELHRS